MRACRVCSELKPHKSFGVGRYQHVCRDCVITNWRLWNSVSAKVASVYGFIQGTNAREK
ncbi:hypothetical protein SAMN05443245_5855 [Paraburkholderia fungorum]|uniref:Uncharacterized protein n=1 Tax=Paraburkholderia fungorum TaxID=134537 RepID=A0A1H1IXX6_9BURK|nr:hypothetical protein SAMN05443245_5855 [Paraburkholderia fungorum]